MTGKEILKGKGIRWWTAFSLLCLWQLPQVVLFACLVPFMGKMMAVSSGKYSICFVGRRMRGGISLGPFVIISPHCYYSLERDAVIAHEMGHSKDSRIFGPLYLFIIGLPSILNAKFGFTRRYYDFFTEKRANRHAGLVARNDYLMFKDRNFEKKAS